jgi:hypothetical protein
MATDVFLLKAARWRGAKRKREWGPCGSSRVEKEEEGRGGAWCSGRQCAIADNGPWPSGAGGGVAA